MRLIKCRQNLSNDDARAKIANLQQSLTVQQENIEYWHDRIGKPLKPVDVFILHADKLKTPEEMIDKTRETIKYIVFKINDYKRFLTEPYRWFIY